MMPAPRTDGGGIGAEVVKKSRQGVKWSISESPK